MRSSDRSSSPPRLVGAASDIGAERIGSASWNSGDLTTSSVGSGATGTCASVVACPSTVPSGVVPPTGTASEITVPANCVSVIARYVASALGGYDYLRQTMLSKLYIPSTMVASSGVVSAPDAMVSAWGRGVDSSTVAGKFSSAATASGSSPSQDRSVDFLHSTHWVVSQARLLNATYYSGMDFTYKLDRTTVMVGAPSMLAISTSPASAGTSSSA
jgi:hypothetical protein